MSVISRTAISAVLVAVSSFPAWANSWTLNITDTGFDPAIAGGVIEYQVRIGTANPSGADPSQIRFHLPSWMQYLDVSGGLNNCTAESIAEGETTVSCDVPAIASGAAIQATLSVAPQRTGTLAVAGMILDQSSVEHASVEQAATINEGADISLVLSGPETILAGEMYAFSATIKNEGPHPSLENSATFSLPLGMSPNMIMPEACRMDERQITCDLPMPMAVGETLEFDFMTQITADQVVDLTIDAQVQSQQPADPNLENGEAALIVSVQPGVDAGLQKIRLPEGRVLKDDPVTFVLEPSLAGFMPTSGVIEDELPTNYTIGAVTVEGAPASGTAPWHCTVIGQLVSCTFAGKDASDFQKPITIAAIATTETQGLTDPPVLATNHASISVPGDLNSANNTPNDGGVPIILPFYDLKAELVGPMFGLGVVDQEYDWVLSAVNNGILENGAVDPGVVDYHGPLTFTYQMPHGFSLSSITKPANWTCDGVPGPLESAGPQVITCTTTETVSLPVNARSDAIILRKKVTHATQGDVQFAVGPLDNGDLVDRYPGNNFVVMKDGLNTGGGERTADLMVTKALHSSTEGAAPSGIVTSGQPIEFKITVTNHGNAVAEKTDIFDLVDLKVTKEAKRKLTDTELVKKLDIYEPFYWVIRAEHDDTSGLPPGVADQVVLTDVFEPDQMITYGNNQTIWPEGTGESELNRSIKMIDEAGRNITPDCTFVRVPPFSANAQKRQLTCALGDLDYGAVRELHIPAKITRLSLANHTNTAEISTKYPQQDVDENDNAWSYQLDLLDVVHIHGTVWKDYNRNGIRDEHDVGIPGVGVLMQGGVMHSPTEIRQNNLTTTGGAAAPVISSPAGTFKADSLPKGTYTFTAFHDPRAVADQNPPMPKVTDYAWHAALPDGPGQPDQSVRILENVRQLSNLEIFGEEGAPNTRYLTEDGTHMAD